jgi:hypothetical protein
MSVWLGVSLEMEYVREQLTTQRTLQYRLRNPEWAVEGIVCVPQTLLCRNGSALHVSSHQKLRNVC